FLLAAAAAILATAGAATASGGGSAPPDSQLLAMYEPLLQFDPLEQFLPTNVQSFITNADLEQQKSPGTWTVVREHPAPGNPPDSGSWRLNENSCSPGAPIGGLACYAAAAGQSDADPTIYGHVVHENGDTILEYWFFYYDDVYSYTYPASDLFWQAHEGDWEA